MFKKLLSLLLLTLVSANLLGMDKKPKRSSKTLSLVEHEYGPDIGSDSEASSDSGSEPGESAWDRARAWGLAARQAAGSVASGIASGARGTARFVGGAASTVGNATASAANRVFRAAWSREGTVFATWGTIAGVMRHYFGDALGIVPQLKFAQEITDLINKIPTPNRVPFALFLKAAQAAAIFGASVGFTIIDEYLAEYGIATHFNTVLAYATSMIIAENLKALRCLPRSAFAIVERVEAAPDVDLEAAVGGGGAAVEEDEEGEEQALSCLSRAGQSLVEFKQASQKAIGTTAFAAFNCAKKVLANQGVREGISLASLTTLSEVIQHYVGTDAAFVPHLKLAEQISNLAQRTDEAPCLKHARPLAKALVKLGRIATIYGANFVVQEIDKFLLDEFGATSNLSIVMIYAAIIHLSETLKEWAEQPAAAIEDRPEGEELH